MASSYDIRPTSIPSSSTLPRRPSFDYERVRPASPPERRSSPSYESYNSRHSSYPTSDPYREYQRYPSPGVYDRYRDTPVDISWNKSSSFYSDMRGYDYYDMGQGSSARDRDRKDSNSSATVREFKPSDSWKHANGSRERERRNSREYYSSSDKYSPRLRERDGYTGKSSWPSSTPSYSQERPYSRDYRTPERGSDSHRSTRNSYDPDERRRNPRSLTRSPPRRRYRSRSRSHSRSYSRSHSLSRSPSRSRSRTPPKPSRLPVHSFEPEASVAGSSARPHHSQDSSTAKQSSPRISNEPHQTVAPALPFSNKEKVYSPSPSQSSIASSRPSRETSVKPPASRPSDPDVGDTSSTTVGGTLSASKEQSKSLSINQHPTGHSLDSASELSYATMSTPKTDKSKDFDAKASIVNATLTEGNLNTPTSALPKLSSASRQSDVPDSSLGASVDPVVTTPRDPVAAPPPQAEVNPVPPREIRDYSIQDIPRLSEVPTVRDAVRVVIMRRLLIDRQTRQNLVEPVLFSNLSLPKTDVEEPVRKTSIYALMTEMTHPESDRFKARMKTSGRLKQSLVERFKERQDDLKTKVQKLTEEYITLHDKWKVHCAALDRHSRARTEARAADVVPVTVAPPPMTGRTTRRSSANLGDAVRSDLEMEQIIASIGSNEATDPNQLCIRNIAIVPDMISVLKGTVDYVYDDNNLRVDDPVSYYAPQTGIHDWTEEEKQIFIDKFAIFPKQFGAISRFLPNKTTAQCVDYYYLHKNVDIDFKNIVAMNAPGRKGRRRTAKRKANALLADIHKHDAEVSASAGSRGRGGRPKRSIPAPAVPMVSLEPRRPSSRRPLEGTPTTATPTPEPEARPKRRRATTNRTSLGNIQQEIEDDDVPEPEPPILVSEPEPEPELRPAKKPRRGGRRVKSAAMVSDDAIDDVFTPPPLADPEVVDPAASARQKVNSEWSETEKELFLKLYSQYGYDPLKIASEIDTKSVSQCGDYYHANEVSLGLRKISENMRKKNSSTNETGDTSGFTAPQSDNPSNDISRVSAVPPGFSVPTFPTAASTFPGDMAALFSHPGFSRFTTGVSPYGAPSQPMSSMYTGPVYSTSNFGYPPPGPNTAGATALSPYAASANIAYPGRPYIPYPFPYQTTYPQMAVAGHPTASATTPSTPGVPTSYPNTAAQPFYPGYT